MDKPRFIIPFQNIEDEHTPQVGAKNASLGEMIRTLEPLGVNIPDGFAITTDAFRSHLRHAGLEKWVYDDLAKLDVNDPLALGQKACEIRKAITQADLPNEVEEALRTACQSFESVPVAVRSSGTAENLPQASCAGQYDSCLNINGWDAISRAVRCCMGSLFSDRAIVHRIRNHYDHRDAAMSVGVQRLVRSDLACAGTIFTIDPDSGFRGVIVIDAGWGLGESAMRGRVDMDEFWVHKDRAKAGFRSIIKKKLGEKKIRTVFGRTDEQHSNTLTQEEVPSEDQKRYCLSDDEVYQLAEWAMLAEEHDSVGRNDPTLALNLEWAKDGETGKLYLLQSRPETVHGRSRDGWLRFYQLSNPGKIILTGNSIGARIASGIVRIVHSPDNFPAVQQGEVLVAKATSPGWESVLSKVAAVVTDQGGRTSHAAVISRELGLPCIVGTHNGTSTLTNGQHVTVSCIEGNLGKVYEGELKYETHEIDPQSIVKPEVPLMLNLADPSAAFKLCQLPVAGVGLLRMEFLMGTEIGIHPMALTHIARVPEPEIRDKIDHLASGYESRESFFVHKVASGIAHIAGAFYPRPVVVRFSDFKSNEYAQLLGGEVFEPKERNPILGFRGASRYYHEKYRDGFAIECATIKHVISVMGFDNVIPMIPFCRTPEEGRLVLEEMARHGLERGKGGLKVFVMCEIPNNIIRAAEFCEHFDGFSLGLNDLTQLSLGIDRDSELLADLFDETDPGMKQLIEMLLERAHANQRTVGICGEAPSNDPAFAQWLEQKGIDSISLNPDALLAVISKLKQYVELPGARAHGSIPAALPSP